jgi:O-antigen/teichoic acid export membrane protein
VLAWLATSVGFNIAMWRPDVWKLRFTGTREILKFGTQMIGIGGINQLNTRAGEMTLGSLLGLNSLGLYTRASSLPMQLYNNIFGSAAALSLAGCRATCATRARLTSGSCACCWAFSGP